MENKNMRAKRAIIISILILIGITIFSWFNVQGKEIQGAIKISPECSVKIIVGREEQQEYTLGAEQIEMLRTLILESSFRKVFSSLVIYPFGTEHYTILIDWNNQRDFLPIHSLGNEYISIPDQFNGKHLKIKNSEWEKRLKEIISLSNPV